MMYGVELPTGTWALNRRKAENERGEGEGRNEGRREGGGRGMDGGGRQTGGDGWRGEAEGGCWRVMLELC